MILQLVTDESGKITHAAHNGDTPYAVDRVEVVKLEELDANPAVVEGKKRLHLGCGNTRLDDAVNVDYVKTDAVDVVYDLSHTPWPKWWAPDNYYEHVEAFDIIEHFVHVIPVIEQIYRTLKKTGTLHIHTTSWNTPQSFTDPSHHHFFTPQSFDYWDPSTFFGSKYGWYRNGSGVMRIISARQDGQEMDFWLMKE
jgi:SAM-dependent methyltransferase